MTSRAWLALTLTLHIPSHTPRSLLCRSYGYGCAQANFYAVYTRVACFLPWLQQRVPSLVAAPPSVASLASALSAANATVQAPAAEVQLGVRCDGVGASSGAQVRSALVAAAAALLAPWGVPPSRIGVIPVDASLSATLAVRNVNLSLWTPGVLSAFQAGLAADVAARPGGLSVACALVAASSNVQPAGARRRLLVNGSDGSTVLVTFSLGSLGADPAPAAALAQALQAGALALSGARGALASALRLSPAAPQPLLSAAAPSLARAPLISLTLLLTAFLPPGVNASGAAAAAAALSAAAATGSLSPSFAFAAGTALLTFPAAAAPPTVVVRTRPANAGLLAMAVGLGAGAAFVLCAALALLLAARARRRAHAAAAEATIAVVRSKVLHEGLVRGTPLAQILSHPSMRRLSSVELNAAVEAHAAAVRCDQTDGGDPPLAPVRRIRTSFSVAESHAAAVRFDEVEGGDLPRARRIRTSFSVADSPPRRSIRYSRASSTGTARFSRASSTTTTARESRSSRPSLLASGSTDDPYAPTRRESMAIYAGVDLNRRNSRTGSDFGFGSASEEEMEEMEEMEWIEEDAPARDQAPAAPHPTDDELTDEEAQMGG